MNNNQRYLLGITVFLVASIFLFLVVVKDYTKQGKKVLLITTSEIPEEIKNKNVSVSNVPNSKEQSVDDWNRLGSKIFKEYGNFDIFVIEQDLDRIPYTASALSFMLEGINKPVIVMEKYTNLVGKNLGAGVCILHNGKLENRNSPNPQTEFKFLPFDMKKRVIIIKMFPGITADAFTPALAPFVSGIIIDSNECEIPDSDDIRKVLSKLSEKGIKVIENRNNMTTETTFAKLSLILSHVPNVDLETTQKLMGISMRGE
jgi:L-asparaginase/Glu-tRNA(Gln) amidotransferase subunit D